MNGFPNIRRAETIRYALERLRAMHKAEAARVDLYARQPYTAALEQIARDRAARIGQLVSAIEDGLFDLLDAAVDVPADSYSGSSSAAFAWHTLRCFQDEHPFDDPGLHDVYEMDHPAQCGLLPPGARCWIAVEPHHEWWPSADQYGTYRMRPTWHLVGSGPDGEDPDVAEGWDIQQLDEATGTWSDWDGPTAGETSAPAPERAS